MVETLHEFGREKEASYNDTWTLPPLVVSNSAPRPCDPLTPSPEAARFPRVRTARTQAEAPMLGMPSEESQPSMQCGTMRHSL